MMPPKMTADQTGQGDPVPVSFDRGRPADGPMGRICLTLEKPKVTRLMLAGVLVTAALVYLVLLRPEGFGSYHDDGMYAVLAKALATGQGYKVISLPFDPDQTKSPPFYPFLLSLIWRIYPQFPQNVTWMMLLSVVATVSFLALAYALSNQIDQAVERLKTALKHNPDYPGLKGLAFQVALRQADLKLKQQDWDGISSAVALALEAGPASPEGARELLRFKSALPVSHIKAGSRQQAFVVMVSVSTAQKSRPSPK
jgi:hypothetical protein